MVRYAGAKRASVADATVAEAKMLEAKLKLAMGGAVASRGTHTVGEPVAGYFSDGSDRLSPGSVKFYRDGEAAMPESFRDRPVSDVTPLALDGMYTELREAGASEHKVQKVHRLLSAAFNRAANS